ncbi:MAG: hypothetical protein V1722_03200 [Candidatus Micrarchaeota archaeon]
MYSNIIGDKAISIFEKVLKKRQELTSNFTKNNCTLVAKVNSYAKRKKGVSSDKLKQILRNKVSALSLKNILITNELKELLISAGIQMRCFILHGSSVTGTANVSVKTGEIKYFKKSQYAFSEFFVTAPEASDMDIVLIVENTKQSQEIASIATELSVKYQCQFTINLISSKVIRREITASAIASPAIKRIFGLHASMCFYGYDEFDKFQLLALRKLRQLDIAVDIDLKLLKQFGSIMSKSGIKQLRLNKNYLASLFPFLFLSRVTDFNLDFPKERLKLVIPLRKQPLTSEVKIT